MKNFLLGLGSGLTVMSCAAVTTVPWPYYGLTLQEYKNGKLLAVDPRNDKDISFCAPTSGKKGKCIVMDGPDFYAFKAAALQCNSDLVACQRGIAR